MLRIAINCASAATAATAARHLEPATKSLLPDAVRKKRFYVCALNGITHALGNREGRGNEYMEEIRAKLAGLWAKTDGRWLCSPSPSSKTAYASVIRRSPERSVRRMSTVVESLQSSSADGIMITDKCIRRLKEIHKEDGPGGDRKMLRLSVEGGGCSGFLYNFSLDDKLNSDDRWFEKNGVKVVVDEISLSFVKGSTIDFSEELIRASFTVSANPNAASGCGCGASFTAK